VSEIDESESGDEDEVVSTKCEQEYVRRNFRIISFICIIISG
jgi:hypothetical protein